MACQDTSILRVTNDHREGVLTKEGARQLLKEWGNYLRRNQYHNLGYPPENTIGRIMREGPGASQGTAPIDPPLPVYFETVNSIVCKMDKSINEAVYCRFVKHMNDRKGSSECHCSKSEFRNRIERGIIFTAGAMSFAN